MVKMKMYPMTHTPTNSSAAELLSAMVDGELNAHVDLPDLQHPAVHAQWNEFQTIGEVLRASNAVGSQIYGADAAFLQRLSSRLADERIEKLDTLTVSPGALVDARPNAAASNDPTFRWKLVAGVASFGMAAVVALNLGGLSGSKQEPQVVQGIPGTERVVASSLGPMVRDARLEELLSAHKQLGGTSLQAPSGFLRHAGFESAPGSQR